MVNVDEQGKHFLHKFIITSGPQSKGDEKAKSKNIYTNNSIGSLYSIHRLALMSHFYKN